MDLTHYKGEKVADPGRFIRLTLRGHYVRWRLERELAGRRPSCDSREGGEAPRPADPPRPRPAS